MYSSPLPCYLVSLRPKYPPQHPILEHPQPMFLPQCERPSTSHTLRKTRVELIACLAKGTLCKTPVRVCLSVLFKRFLNVVK
jgi:hypothetical protein